MDGRSFAGSGSPKDGVGQLDDFMTARSTTPSSSKCDDSPGRRTLDNDTDEDDRERSTPVNSLSKVTFDMASSNESAVLTPSVGMSPSREFGRSVESLTRDIADGLTLMEQQNVKIDEHRLSATIGLFDPLSQERGVVDRVPRRSLPECLISVPMPTVPPRSYLGQGARPKVAFRPIDDVEVNDSQSVGHMLPKPTANNVLFDVAANYDSGNRSSSGSSDKSTGSGSQGHGFDNCDGPLVDIPGVTTPMDATVTPTRVSIGDAKVSNARGFS